MIPLRDQELLRQRFQRDLTSRVRLDVFSQKPSPVIVPGRQECAFCQEVTTLGTELGALSPRISLTHHAFTADDAAALEFRVDKVPAVIIRGQNNRPVRFFGLPSGGQFPVLVESLLDAARGKVELLPETVRTLNKLRVDVGLQVYVTPTCAHSPAVTRLAYKLALQSVRIKVDVIEAVEFPALATRIKLQATPTIVIDEKVALPGSIDEATLVQEIMRIVEDKPGTGQPRQGNATAFNFPGEARQQPPTNQPQRTASGLIIPR